MFPYADIPDNYWSGYFSSRPNSKIYIRDGQSALHSASKIFALTAVDQAANAKDMNLIFHARD